MNLAAVHFHRVIGTGTGECGQIACRAEYYVLYSKGTQIPGD